MDIYFSNSSSYTILSFYSDHSFSIFDNFMYLLLCISIYIRVIYRERMALTLGIVFLHRKGMVFKVRHSLFKVFI